MLAKYQEALARQSEALKNVSMEVTMEASIPKLKKQGRLNALRRISTLGSITYKVLGFSGDDTVKKEVMARFMTAEVEAAAGGTQRRDELALNETNYSFKYKGLYKGFENKDSHSIHIFELKPKKKRLGLFKGELWIDAETSLPVLEKGQLVKNPSVFIKKMEFTRSYEIRDGIAWLVRMESRTDTRIVGRAELKIDYANFVRQQNAEEAVEEATGR